MENKEISIVIPLKNTPSKPLEECLESVFDQELSDIQLICVDDGSDSEKTKQVLNDFESAHTNMKVIHLKKSVGAGEARNIGFREVNGKYTIFFDSDDVMLPKYLANLHSKIVKEDADVCISGYSLFHVDDNGERIVKGGNKKGKGYKDKDWDFLMADGLSPCNKLCRTSYLKENRIEFQSLTSDNDLYYAGMVLLCTDKIVYSGDCESFLYRFNTSYQITARRDPYNISRAVEKLRNEIVKRPQFKKEYIEMIDTYYLVLCRNELLSIVDENKRREFYCHCQESTRNIPTGAYNYKLNALATAWRNETFESKWYSEGYDCQLKKNSKQLLERLCGKKYSVWGMGDRAKAFEKFMLSHESGILGICDKNNNDIGSQDAFGNTILNCDEVISGEDYVIASNRSIAVELGKIIDKSRIIDLEEYCPV